MASNFDAIGMGETPCVRSWLSSKRRYLKFSICQLCWNGIWLKEVILGDGGVGPAVIIGSLY